MATDSYVDEDNWRDFAILKPMRRSDPPTSRSIISLHAEFHVRFLQVDAPSAKSLSSDLWRLYRSKDGFDVTFTFQDGSKQLGAHKWLLRARSRSVLPEGPLAQGLAPRVSTGGGR